MHRIWDYKNAFRILKGGKISLVVSAFLTTASIVNAAPTGGNVTSGNATISQNGNVTNINQSSNKASINWQDFSIGKNETVNFNQPNSNSITLNKVVGTSNSLIQGAMNANGQVILVNPNGVVFTEGSNVNVGGLIATTKNITDQDFQNDNYKFEGDSSASIINKGTINAKYVAMMGKEVVNEGKIVATMGRVELSSGDKFTLNLNGDSLLKLTIDEGTLNALVENKGLIKADGGVVYLTTKAVDSILDGMVNNTGIIEAQTLNTNDKGEIVLFAHGGTANVAGEIKAEGGFVETSGAKVKIADDFKVKAKDWLIDPNDFTIAASGGDMSGATLSSNLANANVEIQTATMGTAGGNGDIHVNDNVSWSSGNTLTLNAERNININSTIDASSGSGGKVVLNYGQGAVAANNTATYDFGLTSSGFAGKINLQAGQNFSTKLGSDGTQVDYTVITALGSAGDETTNPANSLQAMANSANLATNFVLGTDIDASATSGWNGGEGFKPIGVDHQTNNNFAANFDGLGHSITGLTINRPNTTYVGLFAYALQSNLSNLAFITPNIIGHKGVGTLVGQAEFTNISNILIDGGTIHSTRAHLYAEAGALAGVVSINNDTGNSYVVRDVISSANVTSSGGSIGGVIGTAWDRRLDGLWNGGTVYYSPLDIMRISSSGNVTGANERVGGLLGYWSEGVLSDSYATGAVSGTSSVGGLIGLNDWGAKVENSYATGNVTGTGNAIGGLVGYNYGHYIKNSHATGNVTGNNQLGGLVGKTDAFESWGVEYVPYIENSYATGSVIGNTSTSRYIGGLVGEFSETYSNESTALIKNSYHTTGTLIGESGVGGLVGYLDGGKIENSYATSDVTGSELWIGGLVGYLSHHAVVANSYATGTVKGNAITGGLVGMVDEGKIYNSYATGNVIAQSGVHSVERIGGLVGYLASDDENLIENSYATGNVVALNVSQNIYGRFVGGLVGYADEESTIKNSHATGNVSGSREVGGFVGYSEESTIENSYATGNITATGGDSEGIFIGGFIGDNEGTIINSYATGTVIGINDVGGFVGSNNAGIFDSYATGAVNGTARIGGFAGMSDGTIIRAYARGSIIGVGDNQTDLGGFIGRNDSGIIEKSFAIGNVTSDGSNGEYVGGFVGYNYYGQISDVYALGNVTGFRVLGGFVGYNESGYISNAYSIGTVTGQGNYIGAFSGDNTYGNVYDSFWDIETSGNTFGIGGNNGGANNPSNVNGISGKTTAQMKTLATYPLSEGEVEAWDIIKDPSLTDVYPQLRWATDGLGNGISVWVIGKTGLTYVVTGGTKTYGQSFTLPNPTFVGGTPSGNATVKVFDANNNDVTAQAIAGTLAVGTYTVKTVSLNDNNYGIASSGNVDGILTIVADNSGNNGSSENPNKEIEKQEQKVNNIITNIVNNAVKPNLPVLSLNPIRTDVVNGFERRVNSTIVNNRPQIGNENTLGTLNLGLNEIIRSVKPAVNEIVKENKLTIVGETGGESKIEIVELQDLVAKSGGGELRVALSPNSFVELVNGGVNLPDGVSQEFYVVEDKK